jgi:hypothetical protein
MRFSSRHAAWTAALLVAVAGAGGIFSLIEGSREPAPPAIIERSDLSTAARPSASREPAPPAILERSDVSAAARPSASSEPARPDGERADAHPPATGSIPTRDAGVASLGAAPSLGSATTMAAPVAPYRFVIRREAGALVFSGSIPDRAAREELAAYARERFFHERLVDETRLADGAPQAFLSGARFALDQLSQLAEGEASLLGGAVRIQGEALYAQTAQTIEAKVKSAPPRGWRGSAEVRARGSDRAGEP